MPEKLEPVSEGNDAVRRAERREDLTGVASSTDHDWRAARCARDVRCERAVRDEVAAATRSPPRSEKLYSPT